MTVWSSHFSSTGIAEIGVLKMVHPTRREIILGATALATSTLGTSRAAQAAERHGSRKGLSPVLHIAFFWLKNKESKEDIERFLDGLQAFAAIESVRGIHVGVPDLDKQRDVVDSSYSASIVLIFDDFAGYSAHIAHPVHHKFAADCGSLIDRVVVYDPKLARTAA